MRSSCHDLPEGKGQTDKRVKKCEKYLGEILQGKILVCVEHQGQHLNIFSTLVSPLCFKSSIPLFSSFFFLLLFTYI